ncbi:uncharacterized protein LOC120010885 isoform X2 [Tripterygium wilfordii]|uniref:uncharacterized protein LOC120010885 isoform X2 n=1 Tax=Tripterygium wilfordii TaxID=458696 RepID=UPI0018F8379D|nr:uncharacterized protein LOC120010885 isoform X2 [Tripterygium wilfordii]
MVFLEKFQLEDIISVLCTHLELFRATQAKIEKKQTESLTVEDQDKEIGAVLAAENKLHPALFSAEAEHKVLQHLMHGLISFTFKPEDLQCSFFRLTTRELLACAVIRPVLNLASPRFINERIESVVISMTKANKRVTAAQEASQSKPNASAKISSDRFSRILDPTVTGVELVQLKNYQSRTKSNAATASMDNDNGNSLSKDPLLSMDTPSSRSWNSLPFDSQTSEESGIQHCRLGEWGDMLDLISRRKTAALAPEHFENIWTKGRNYRKKEEKNQLIEQIQEKPPVNKPVTVVHSNANSKPKKMNGVTKLSSSQSHDDEHSLIHMEDVESGGSSYTSEEEDTGNVTGLDSPGTKVWDGKSKRNLSVSHIHHPLENPKGHMRKKNGRSHHHYQGVTGSHSIRKRSRSSNQNLHVWQEVERTSFLSGDGQDILNSLKERTKVEDSSDDSETGSWDRLYSGAMTSSSAASLSRAESHSLSVHSLRSSFGDSFFKLRCEVLGANIVKSGSRTFAVYSISVTDVNNNSWSIKRRFRHFEELHRRLKEFPEYHLHLPPKHFLSTGLDVPVIQERCKLLDKYLKELLQHPTISGTFEVWDFLSVDSQTYVFSSSFSIVETLSVDLDDKPSEKDETFSNIVRPLSGSLSSTREQLGTECNEATLQTKNNFVTDGIRLTAKDVSFSPGKKPGKESVKSIVDSDDDVDIRTQKDRPSIRNSGKILEGRKNGGKDEASMLPIDVASDHALPTEWVPPNISVPILDLVDVIFQLQDGGWIRRKAFWVAKQILQLGMGDALDDWLIEKIQLLRRGSVVASGIKRIEQILWPDGIFLTKHPKRRQPQNSPQNSPHGGQPTGMSSPRLSEEQQQEADRRAKFVYELMIANAPAAVVGLVGRKEYEQCAKDLYFFLQSSVCLKQLAFDLLELLLLSAFPEMDYVFKQLHEEKHRFGEFRPR